MSFERRFELPIYDESDEHFKCPYDHQCENCEFDCGDDLQ